MSIRDVPRRSTSPGLEHSGDGDVPSDCDDDVSGVYVLYLPNCSVYTASRNLS